MCTVDYYNDVLLNCEKYRMRFIPDVNTRANNWRMLFACILDNISIRWITYYNGCNDSDKMYRDIIRSVDRANKTF